MTLDQKLDKAEEFLAEFKKLVHKHAGDNYAFVDQDLLAMMQERTSVYQPYIWS